MLQAMHQELDLQKNYLQQQTIETIYFGGGTPSILQADELQQFIDHVARLHSVAANAEITIEANPDDLSRDQVQALRQTMVNRFSIGVQSFYDEDLQWMNRAHTSQEADAAVKRVQDAGFSNITLDLIYGYPLLNDEKWKSNIRKVTELQVPHISAYSMTVEPRTALAHFIKKGKQQQMDDSQSAEQFIILADHLSQAGFEHYEISNFARPGFYSKHNTSYWQGVSYLGIGPSAHSYNGSHRQWNIANNHKYIESLTQQTLACEIEELSSSDRFNEYIMTALRTMWGIDLNKTGRDFGTDYQSQTIESLQEFLLNGWVENNNDVIILTREGKLFADHIASSLFTDPD